MNVSWSAAASTVVVTFNAENGSQQNILSEPSGFSVSGTWVESGFDVDWVVTDAFGFTPEEVADVASARVNDIPLMADFAPGAEPIVQSMRISASDGRAFGVVGLDVLGVRSNYISTFSFTPLGRDGQLDFSQSQSERFAYVADNMRLTGQRMDGSTTVVDVNAFLEATAFLESNDVIPSIGNGTWLADSVEATLLSDLAYLDLEVFFAPPTASDIRASLAFSGVDHPTLANFDACLAVNPTGSGCDLPGIGSAQFNVEPFGGVWNWGTAVPIDNLTLAPVPLPPGLPLLAGAVLFLAVLRQQEPRRPAMV
jgi:hypothetical protein